MVRDFIKNMFSDYVLGVSSDDVTICYRGKKLVVTTGFICNNLIGEPQKMLNYHIIDDMSVGSGSIPISNIEYEYFLAKCKELQEQQTLAVCKFLNE